MLSNQPLRFPLAHLPTPVEFLPRLSEAVAGPRIFIKRDDLTGLAGGGNKVRKLEFLLADALERRCDSLVTIGAAQSNHCRQTAAAAARAGIRCILILRGNPTADFTGNLLLDHLLGARIVWAGELTREEVMGEVVQSEIALGRRPYPIPLGGSNALGSAAYALALKELLGQMERPPDRVVFSTSSGGTHAGMVVGADRSGYKGELLGISIDEPLEELQQMVSAIASECSRLLGRPRVFAPGDIHACADYLGAGYGIMGPPEREAIELFARTEGILLDPVYTGRAAAGMIDLIRRGVIGKGETIVFWHTGGIPALYAYARELTTKSPGHQGQSW